eukprot:350136-Chlamydomonas_euryale.AAC.5
MPLGIDTAIYDLRRNPTIRALERLTLVIRVLERLTLVVRVLERLTLVWPRVCSGNQQRQHAGDVGAQPDVCVRHAVQPRLCEQGRRAPGAWHALVALLHVLVAGASEVLSPWRVAKTTGWRARSV